MNKSLANVIDKEEGFYFRPYSYVPGCITKPVLFGKMNDEIGLIPREMLYVSANTVGNSGPTPASMRA